METKVYCYLLFIFFPFQQLLCQDTISSVDLFVKTSTNGSKAYYKSTEKLFTGYLVEHYSNGKYLFVSYYKDGVNKESKNFYENGKIQSITLSDDQGNEDGKYLEWDENGKIKTEGNFLEGKRNGFWRFCKDGVTESIGTYKYDLKVGIWKYYDSDAKLIKKEFYINGVLQ